MFLDSTVVIEILQEDIESKRFKEIFKHIEDEPLFISVVQIGEIADWCLREKLIAEEFIQDAKEFVNIIPLSDEIGIEGSKIKFNMRKKGIKKFSLIDGIILASAKSINQKLLTTDSDFRKDKDAIVISAKKNN